MTFVSNTGEPMTVMVGYAFVPFQTADMNNLYSAEKGLSRGTLFPELDLPMEVYGMQSRRMEEKR